MFIIMIIFSCGTFTQDLGFMGCYAWFLRNVDKTLGQWHSITTPTARNNSTPAHRFWHKTILYALSNWTGQILCGYLHLVHVTERKDSGKNRSDEKTRTGRIYWIFWMREYRKLQAEAPSRPPCRIRYGTGYGSVVRQTNVYGLCAFHIAEVYPSPYLLGLLDSSLCRRCGAGEEISAHILCEGEALASRRHAHLGWFLLLEPADINSLGLGAIWNCSKAAGLPWFDMGHKGLVLIKA